MMAQLGVTRMPAPPTTPYTTDIPESLEYAEGLPGQTFDCPLRCSDLLPPEPEPPGHGVSPRHLHAASMVLGSIITAAALGLICYLAG